MKKLVFLVVFLVAAVAMTWLVWFRPVPQPQEEKKPEAEVPVHVAKITRATMRSFVTAYGSVEPDPKASARVASTVPGIVAIVNCAEGQTVEKGALLFQLDSRAVDVAVTFAEKTVERQQRLTKVDGTSQKALQEAEQTLAAARAQQSFTQIRSPLAGVVTKVNSKAGEAADSATVLAEIVDLGRLVVTANVASGELAAVQAGQSAEIVTPDSTNVVTSPVGFTSLQVDPKTGSGLARVPLPAGSGLRPGQFVRLRIVTAEHKDTLVVPLAGIAKDTSGAVFVALVEGDKAVLKPVKVGVRDQDLVEVEGEGVDADKTVVTEGAYGLIMSQQFATKIRVVND